MKLVTSYMDSHRLKFNFKKTEFVVVAPKTHNRHKQLVLKMNGQEVTQKKEARLLGLYITYNMSQSHYVEDMKNNLLSFLSQRFAVLAIMSERACIKNRKQLAYGLIYSKLIFGIQYWISECSEAQKKEIQILLMCGHTHTHTQMCCHTFGVVTFMFSLSWVNVPAPQKIRLHVMW